MNFTVPLAIYGWPLVVLGLFLVLPTRRAIIVAMLAAWLFLPMAGYQFSGLPDIDKMSVTCLSLFVAVIVFDGARFLRLRWCWLDLAALVWVTAPIPSAVLAGFGFYEGFSGFMNQAITSGMPFLIGRIYFSSLDDLNELAVGIFIAGLIYIPFVLYEVRMSPQLHTMVYGFHQHQFLQSKRMGGWRPTVFMQHGLAVAMFMNTAAICGYWLWLTGRVRTTLGMPIWLPLSVLLVVAVLCKSSYAMVLLAIGIAALWSSRLLKTRWPLVGLISLAPLYMFARTFGGWDAQILIDAANTFGESRASSFTVRLRSENSLWNWVQGNLLFGRGRVAELMLNQGEFGRFIPDGFWIIVLGRYGLVGLVSIYSLLLVPAGKFLWRTPTKQMFGAPAAGALTLCVVLALYSMDCLQNAMLNPLYLLATGGLASLQSSKIAEAYANDSRHPSAVKAPRTVPLA